MKHSPLNLQWFSHKVDKRSKSAMIKYLEDHPRYSTMNTWNGLKSFSNNVKLNRIQKPAGIDTSKMYDFLEIDEVYEAVNDDLSNFKYENPGYSIGFNGRSSGYLVLYQDKSNAGAYEDCDFSEMELSELREATKLIQEFDKYCNYALGTFFSFVKDYDVIDEQIQVTKTIRVLKAVA